MAKKQQEHQDDEKILTQVEARRKYKAENPDEPDHPAGREEVLVVAKAAAAAALPPVDTTKEKQPK